MNMICGTAACLTACVDVDDPVVEDAHGGRWYPGEEAAAEILAADDPEEAAVRICHETPTRGQWRS